MRILLPVLLLVLSCGAGAAELQVLDWSLGALGRGITGTAVLVDAREDGWRASLAGAGASWDDLLAERGDGWTLVGAPDGRAWGSPWGEPLRDLPSHQARALSELCRHLRGEGEGLSRLVVREATAAGRGPNLRTELAARAAGRGGRGETVFLQGGDREGHVLATSRRRPGGLSIRTRRSVTVPVQAADLLLPAWSLAELLDQG